MQCEGVFCECRAKDSTTEGSRGRCPIISVMSAKFQENYIYKEIVCGN
jgi:hypothetical protein